MKFEKIHHVAIIASDYEASKAFYTEVLELPIIRENYRADRDSYKLDLKLGESEIELFSFPNPPERPSGPESVGLRHLCFYVEDVEATVAELNRKGVETDWLSFHALAVQFSHSRLDILHIEAKMPEPD